MEDIKKYFISGKIYSTNQINDILLDKDSSDIRTGWATYTITGTKEEFSSWVDKFLELSDDAFKLYDCGEVKEKVEANIQYQDYLENVCQSMAKYFPEIQDILSRYSTLRDANQQLLASKEQDDNERDMKEKEYNLFRKGKENQLLNQNNEIAEMQIQLEKAVNLRSAIQKDIDKSQNEASDKTLTLGAVLSGVTNVLNRCEESFRNRHNKPMLENVVEKPPDNDDELRDEVDKTCLKLEEVAMFMVDFNEIKRMYADYVKATLEA